MSTPKSLFRAFALALLALPLCMALSVSLLGDSTSNTPPSQDPFYRLPSNLESYSKGSIIRSRQIPANDFLGNSVASVYQLLYRTNGVNSQADAAVTTVIAPTKPAAGGAKIIAIATPQDSAAVDCATSWSMYPSTASKGVNEALFSAAEANAALYNGFYVTIPDLGGSKAAWIAYSEGQVMLDSIRAILNHKPTISNKQGYKAALTGYSGGGHGAAWAGQLASTYGKGLNIVALAAGGVPVDLETNLQFLENTQYSALEFLAVAGLSNAYSEVNDYFRSILTSNGSQTIAAVRNGEQYCATQALATFGDKSMQGSTKGGFSSKNSLLRKIYDQNYLGRQQDAITSFPIYLAHSRVDKVVTFGPAQTYYSSQCKKGAKITFSALPSGDHILTGALVIPSFFEFIIQAFEGSSKVNECSTISNLLVPLDSTQAASIVGPETFAMIQAFVAAETVTGTISSLEEILKGALSAAR